MVQPLETVEPSNGRYHLVPGSDPNLDRPFSKQKHIFKSQDDAPTWREMSVDIVTGLRFNAVIAVCILGNAVVIGLETDNPGRACWAWIEDGFLTLFTLELALRLISFGPVIFFDFHSQEFFWNMFDSAIVFAGLVEYAASLFARGSTGNGHIITFFRLLRISRLMRMFRLIRFLKEFNLLTFGFAAALAAIRYVALLMVVAIYLYAVLIVQIVLHWNRDSEHFDFLTSRFGTMSSAMLSLFSLMSEPDLSIYREIMSASLGFSMFLISFVVFISFGMIGLLTGLVCESMFDKNHLRLEEERLDREATRRRIVARLEEVFDSITDEHNDEASTEKVLQLLPVISNLFVEEEVTFAMHDLEEIAGLMDVDGSGTISKTEFCRGILQIAEGLSPVSIMELHYVTSHAKLKADNCEAMLLILLQGLGLDVARIALTHSSSHGQDMQSKASSSHTRASRKPSKLQRDVTPSGEQKALLARISEQLRESRERIENVQEFQTRPLDGAKTAHDVSRCLDELREISKKVLSELEPMRRQSTEAYVCADIKSLREASFQKEMLSEIASLRTANETILAELVSPKDFTSSKQLVARKFCSKDLSINPKRNDSASQMNSSLLHRISAVPMPMPETCEMKEGVRWIAPEQKLPTSEGLLSATRRSQNEFMPVLRSVSAGRSWKDGDVLEATGRWRRALAEPSD
eukprot:TRINITY_DN108070_c0_g1_i1.p1 TRINITY_DN108070_c0_g1~~TRINITY_DN108070_c0_g1_i1.p1  ORF type:complete len:692 (-),score=125.19 TRINITY_DN108070_c0_g1_i1:56-2131(-)